MNLIKRLTTSVTASLESAVGQLENHDAIVQATIKQTRQSTAQTRARINTLQQQLTVYETQLDEVIEQQNTWTDRAKELADRDEAKALECLQRRNQLATEQKRLQQRIAQQKELIDQVTINLEKLQKKLGEMEQKHTLLRTRQSVANVNRATANAEVGATLDDTFERWESLVLEHELGVNEGLPLDSLDQEFTKLESARELKAQLDVLKNEASDSSGVDHE